MQALKKKAIISVLLSNALNPLQQCLPIANVYIFHDTEIETGTTVYVHSCF